MSSEPEIAELEERQLLRRAREQCALLAPVCVAFGRMGLAADTGWARSRISRRAVSGALLDTTAHLPRRLNGLPFTAHG